MCLTAPFTPKPLTFSECKAQKDELGIKECCYSNGCNRDGDYWAGAVKACKDQGKKLPTMAQLAELASQMYVGNPSIGAYEDKDGIQYDGNSSAHKALGLTPWFSLWSGEEQNLSNAYYRRFFAIGSGWANGRNNPSGHAVCVGE